MTTSPKASHVIAQFLDFVAYSEDTIYISAAKSKRFSKLWNITFTFYPGGVEWLGRIDVLKVQLIRNYAHYHRVHQITGWEYLTIISEILDEPSAHFYIPFLANFAMKNRDL